LCTFSEQNKNETIVAKRIDQAKWRRKTTPGTKNFLLEIAKK